MSGVPAFAIVGRVNKGKSSVVATLAEDPTVEIHEDAGTTRRCREYPVEVDGERLFVLVDTPGFEEADRALAWLRERESSAAARPDVVRDFVDAHDGSPDFETECRLLRPILDGAGVLYVVDGTQPYRRNYEAEMEILAWTGQPRMALVNRIGDEDHAAEWRAALDQYFKVVRDFDAHAATFQERLALLEDFRVLRPEWREVLDRATEALRSDRARRLEEATDAVTELLLSALGFSIERSAARHEDLDGQRAELQRVFHDELRARERRQRRRVEEVFRHEGVVREDADLAMPRWDEDLFAERSWTDLGLTGWQLVAAGVVGGAAVGLGIDAALGGLSGGGGAVAGGAVGGVAGAVRASQRLADVRTLRGAGSALKTILGHRRLPTFRIGPHASPNFPFVLIDRALLHLQAVEARTHAERDALRVSSTSRQWSEERRRRVARLAAKVRAARGDVPRGVHAELRREVRSLVREVVPA